MAAVPGSAIIGPGLPPATPVRGEAPARPIGVIVLEAAAPPPPPVLGARDGRGPEPMAPSLPLLALPPALPTKRLAAEAT
mmetsp:Transcript_112758/g.313770  ORF Transcript_112758/g.313770 Transcript_112758/m.313770 type:complete len:80 (-) Transcript_112758:1886-2125(-)